MARIERKQQKVFAGSAANNGQFGSAQTGAKVLSNDLDTIQALSAFVNGWNDATISSQKLPTLEEMQALHFLTTSQIAYLFQEGIPEYLSTTEFHENSIVRKSGTYELYGSKINDNIGNALPVRADDANWQYLIDLGKPDIVGTTTYIAATGSMTVPDNVYKMKVKIYGASGGGAGDSPGNNGASGGDSTLTYDSIVYTAEGGEGGKAGLTVSSPDHGGASGGDLNITGLGNAGGIGNTSNNSTDGTGTAGGNGGYCEVTLDVVAGETISYVIGAGGAAGGSGFVGQPAFITLEY